MNFPHASALAMLCLLLPFGSDGFLSVRSINNGDVRACTLLIAPRGYTCEEHEVTTSDGYILSMQRIPTGSSGIRGSRRPRQPVLLQHGVLVDGMTWLLNPPNQSLPFILADSGFDVWVANTRGTRWSRHHMSLDPSNWSYWDWSWDDLAINDLPAFVNYVHTRTGQKLHYVGHSMGTLIALAAFSEGRLVDKIKSAALLSPVAYLTHMYSPVGILCARAFVGEIVSYWLGIAEFNPAGQAVQNFLKSLCKSSGINCFDLLTSFTGNNWCLNTSAAEFFLQFEPQSTSTKTMIHLAQTHRGGVLAKYDYERADLNMESYGQSTPPAYNLSNIPCSLPLLLSYGGRDALSDAEDVMLLLDDLKLHDPDKLMVHYLKDLAHADFVVGVCAAELVYPNMISFFNNHV